MSLRERSTKALAGLCLLSGIGMQEAVALDFRIGGEKSTNNAELNFAIDPGVAILNRDEPRSLKSFQLNAASSGFEPFDYEAYDNDYSGDKYSGSLNRQHGFEGADLKRRQIEVLTEQSIKGGLAGSFADSIIESIAIADDTDCKKFTKPVISELNFHINPYHGRATFDIKTIKELPDGCASLKDSHTGDPKRSITRRWVIAVVDGGLRHGPINSIESDQDGNPVNFTHKLFARGESIHVIAFYEDGLLVRDFDAQGMPDPRAKVYNAVENACIDVKMVDNPFDPFDPTKPEAREGTIISEPGKFKFCAGGCDIPGVLATM